MKLKYSKPTKALAILLLMLFSWSVTAKKVNLPTSNNSLLTFWGGGGAVVDFVETDTLRNTDSTSFFLIPRQALDFYNVQSVRFDSLQKENIRLYYIHNLYKQSLAASVKVDQLQEERYTAAIKVVEILDGNYKQMRKRVLKIRIKNIFSDIKEPIFLVGGFVLGFMLNQVISL